MVAPPSTVGSRAEAEAKADCHHQPKQCHLTRERKVIASRASRADLLTFIRHAPLSTLPQVTPRWT